MTRRSSDGGRAKVIDAARTFFAQKGFHQTSMAELSERAEVSVGQIYRLFANKSEVIIAIVQEDITARLTQLGLIRDDARDGRIDAREAFRRVVLESLNNGEDALTFEILAEGLRNPVVGGAIGALCEQYRAMLGAIVLCACPCLADAKLAAAQEMLIALMFGLGNRTLAKPTLDIPETASFATDMVLAMLRY